MFPRQNHDKSSSAAISENDRTFYEQINKELCDINIELRHCEKVLEELCGKLYTLAVFSENVMKEYAESQTIFNPAIFVNALNLTNLVEEIKRKHLDWLSEYEYIDVYSILHKCLNIF